MLPNYESFMRPLLDVLNDTPQPLPQVREAVATRMSLPDAALALRSDWDKRPMIDHRLETAAENLEQARLLERGPEGWRATARASEAPASLDRQALRAYPEYAAYHAEFQARRGA